MLSHKISTSARSCWRKKKPLPFESKASTVEERIERPWKQWQSKKLEPTLDLKFVELFLFGHPQLVLSTPIIHLHIKQNLKIGQVPLWFHSPQLYPLICFHVRSILFKFAKYKSYRGPWQTIVGLPHPQVHRNLRRRVSRAFIVARCGCDFGSLGHLSCLENEKKWRVVQSYLHILI